MADPTVVLRRMQKARARAADQRLEVAAVLGPAAAVVVAASPAGGEVQAVALAQVGPVVVRGPLDPASPPDPVAWAALKAAGLVVELVDGRCLALGLAGPVELSWPLGVVDQDGRPLPYLRDGHAVVPLAAADGWKWWKGGRSLAETQAALEDTRGRAKGVRHGGGDGPGE